MRIVIMWTCSSCRTANGADAMVCPSCGRPRENQIATAAPGVPTGEPAAERVGDYSTIEKKIRRARIRRDVVNRWAWRCGLAAFITWLVLCVVFFPPGAAFGRLNDEEAIGFVIVFGLIAAAIGMAFGAAVSGAVEMLRPIYVALFRSPEE